MSNFGKRCTTRQRRDLSTTDEDSSSSSETETKKVASSSSSSSESESEEEVKKKKEVASTSSSGESDSEEDDKKSQKKKEDSSSSSSSSDSEDDKVTFAEAKRNRRDDDSSSSDDDDDNNNNNQKKTKKKAVVSSNHKEKILIAMIENGGRKDKKSGYWEDIEVILERVPPEDLASKPVQAALEAAKKRATVAARKNLFLVGLKEYTFAVLKSLFGDFSFWVSFDNVTEMLLEFEVDQNIGKRSFVKVDGLSKANYVRVWINQLTWNEGDTHVYYTASMKLDSNMNHTEDEEDEDDSNNNKAVSSRTRRKSMDADDIRKYLMGTTTVTFQLPIKKGLFENALQEYSKLRGHHTAQVLSMNPANKLDTDIVIESDFKLGTNSHKPEGITRIKALIKSCVHIYKPEPSSSNSKNRPKKTYNRILGRKS